jgi:hypothetical protein
MALKPCRECSAEVSTSAFSCPHCGVRNPVRSSALGYAGLIVIGIVIFAAVSGHNADLPATSAEPPPPSLQSDVLKRAEELRKTLKVTDSCETIASAVAIKTNAVIGLRANDIIALTHPATSEIDLGCPTKDGSFISIFWETSKPPPAFFDFVAKAGSVFASVAELEVRSKAQKCLNDAIRANNGSAELKAGQVTYYCSAGRNFGGLSEVNIERGP